MVERDKKRVARMKWATIVAWPLLALVYIVGVVVEIIHPHTVDLVLALPLLVLFSVAVACTVSWYVRSRFVREREIQASLADIAEQLRQLVKDQQADQPKRGGRPGRESGSETDKG
jgi:nucleotide-binding universal stress UspA family protein